MSALLDQFQGRMEAHFASLNSARAGHGLPIFLLEHGLDANDLQLIRVDLLQRLRRGDSLGAHWLLWAIYATEQGYSYTGHEYWQSFEESTPFWTIGDRWRLPSWFNRFSKHCEAVRPTGAWASHFNRIAWPITHAILPKYLQNQFARALWELSYRLASLTTLDAKSVGRLFALYAHGSNRFHEFLEQEELTGRIVLALLGVQAHAAGDPIHPATLQRLVTDLEQVRHGREWLSEARRVVHDRFAGIGRGAGPPTPRDNTAPKPRQEPEPSLKPSVLLRSDGGGAWTALLDVPDFRPIASTPSLVDFLRLTRVRLAGVGGLRPSGWVLGARRQAVLESWPTGGAPLLGFEHSNPILDNISVTRCAMSAGPTWLFRIGSDGLAREIAGRVVRPATNYLLLGHGDLPSVGSWVDDASVACAGIMARRLTIPAALSPGDVASLRALNLEVAKTIRVWPAGLPARNWNGEGASEWLTTEAPCLGLVHDHPIEGYALSLDGSEPTIIQAGVVGYPTFVRLPPLSAGMHHLQVRAYRGAYGYTADDAPEAEGHLVLDVRDPEPWRPGRSFHSGLVVTTDPLDPDLDAVLENRLDLGVLGPEGHVVRCALTLRRGGGEVFFSEQVGEAMSLPISPAAWSKHFRNFMQKRERGEPFLEASSGQLTIRAEELGEFHIPFEREIRPVRWILKPRRGAILAKLVSDTGHEGHSPHVEFRPFGQPLGARTLSVDACLAGETFAAPGGLLTASLDGHADNVVVSAQHAEAGLQNLGVRPTFPELEHASVDWRCAFATIAAWNEARIAGALLPLRRDEVIEDFLRAVYARVCGSNWAFAERQFRGRPNEGVALDGLKLRIDRNAGFGVLLLRDRARLYGDFAETEAWFAGRANQYLGVTPTLSAAALRFASDPCRLAGERGEGINGLIADLLASPSILRAARFAALLSANPPGAAGVHLLPRWTW